MRELQGCSPVTPFARVLLALATSLFACLAALATPAPTPAPPAGQLPASVYGQGPAISRASISPDGSKVAFVATNNGGEQAIRVIDAVTGANIRAASFAAVEQASEHPVLHSVSWLSERHVGYSLSATFSAQRALPRGARMLSGMQRMTLWRTGILDVQTGTSSVITRETGADWGLQHLGLQAPVIGAPSEARLFMYDAPTADRRLTVYRVNLENAKATPLLRGIRETVDFVLDGQGTALARIDVDRTTNRWSILALGDGPAREVMSGVSPTGAPPAYTPKLTPERELAFVDDPGSLGRDVLYVRSLRDGRPRVLLEDPRYDVMRSIGDANSDLLMGAGIVRDIYTQHFLDPEIAAIAAEVRARVPRGHVLLQNWSKDRRRFAVQIETPADAGGYYLYDAPTHALRRLAMQHPTIVGDHLGDRFTIEYPARDGTRIPAILTLPAGRDIAGLPLVVLARHGPGAREWLGYNAWASFLASRGYAVVQPNFRGVSGFGRAWREAGNRQWAGLIRHDLEDAVHALTRPGKADAARVCILGTDFGGYAALIGAALAPDTYRCAVSVGGYTDLEAHLRRVWRGSGKRSIAADFARQEIGNIDDVQDLARLRAESPVNRADSIRAAVLLVHGVNDTNVPITDSEAMERKLLAAGKRVRLVRLEGDANWSSYTGANTSVLEACEAFLAEHLGGTPSGVAAARPAP